MHLLSSLLCLATALAAVSAQHIPNEYIVVYKSEATEITTATHEAWLLAHATNVNGSPLNDESFKGYPDLPSFPGFRFLQKYSDTGVRGYSAALTSDMAEKISQLPEVAYVERNQIYKAAAALNSYGSTWGLQRISKESLPLPNVFTYPAEAGENSVVYVLDTGIRASHKEFSGRASYGKNFLAPEESGLDQHGHGTHCAGIIAGTTYGVAKKASIVSVKVLDKTGSGRTDVLVSAIQWVKAASLASNKPCIVNIAFTGGASQFLDEAIKDITINGNCLVVASAGNQGRDACRSSPGRLDSTLTVGATQDTDAFLSTSNWGACVKINAPGYYSLSSWSSSNEAKHAASGTSVASSHVAGVAAVAYSQFNFATPFEAMKYIIDKSATSKITGLTGVKSITPNRLLQLPANPSSPSQSLSPGPTSSSTLSPDPTTAQPPITVSSASSTTSAVPTIAPVVPKTGYCVNNNPVRMGYITAWSQYRTGKCTYDLSKINTSKWTHMLYAFGTLSTTGTITLSVDDERYIRQLSAKGIKMILSVGGWGYANLFPPIARDPVAQKRFSDSLAALSSQHGFVGIDIDWEYPAGYKDAAGNIIPGSEGDNLANWLIQLRAAVGPNYLIMMAVPPLPFHLNNYPMTVMATVLDYLLVMTYDFSGPWTTTIGSNTPNNQIFPALDDIVAKGFAREKVVLGLANFGKTYRLSDPVNCRTFGCSFTTTALPKGACSDTEGILFNNEVEWYLPTASVSTDSTTGSSFFITTGNHNTGFPLLDAGINQFVNFETQNDMRVKDDLARTRCLGGTMVWTMDQDTTGSWVVW